MAAAYMIVTADKYELPVMISFNKKDIANRLGYKEDILKLFINKNKRDSTGQYLIKRTDIDYSKELNMARRIEEEYLNDTTGSTLQEIIKRVLKKCKRS